MTRPNKAVPLIAVIDAYGLDGAIREQGAEMMSVSGKDEAKLALTYADAIILTGGGDVDPTRYAKERHASVYGVDFGRDKLEFWLVRKAMERGIPIMGICRGAQVLNVAHGGTLDQNIYDNKGATDHWGTELWVKLSRRSRLARSIDAVALCASHFHHQAVRKVGEGLRPIAWAHDGTIEAIESLPSNPHYVLGVQFHPEMDYKSDENAKLVFRHFVWEIAARLASKRETSALYRLSLFDAEKPARPSYHYGSWEHGKGYMHDDAEEGRWLSYLAEKDDWEYEEWLAENTRASVVGNDELDGVCDAGQCPTPRDCLQYGDCSITVTRHRDALATEHVQWQSAKPDADQVKGCKRGNPGRSA